MAEVRERWEIGGGRGDPDAILQRIREEEEAGEAERFEGRGRLKVFFGYAAGVGKTFAMLTEAHHVQDEGVDVVVGYVEPHTRADTLALLDGLEVLPVKSVKHRNVALREFDLDAALKRRPQVVLVDEPGAYQCAGVPPSQALSRCRRAAPCGYRCVHDGECAASRGA